MKEKLNRYFIAFFLVIFVSYQMMMDFKCPEWYWMGILLSSIMAIVFFGIAEKIYKNDKNWKFSEYPATFSSCILLIISFVMTVKQLFEII